MSFLLASRALVAVAARSLAETADVTVPQFRALVLLSQRPGSAVSDLAADLDIHPTTATRLVDRLVRKRLVRRQTLASDRRVTQLFLTAGGLVMEMGGANSHGAVVAREYGIPAVVGVARATQAIATGDQVTVDGAAGVVSTPLGDPGS